MGDLRPGKWRFLNAKEIQALRRLVEQSSLRNSKRDEPAMRHMR